MATTLLAGNTLRTPSVPGAQLLTGLGTLYAGNALRSPFVPGAYLTNTTDTERIDAVLYDRADLSTALNTLASSFGRSWQDTLSEAGSGEIWFQSDDTALNAFAEDGRDVVAMFYRGVLEFLLVVGHKHEVLVSGDGEGGQQVQYQGLGALGLFAKATIGPTGGGGRSPIEEDRHFGWVASDYDHSGWGYATIYGTAQHVIDVMSFLLSVDPVAVTEKVQSNLPSLDFAIIGPPGTSIVADAPVGDWYTWEDTTNNASLTIATAGDYFIYFVCDDEGEFYVDGQQVASLSGINAFGVTSAAVTLSAGAHTVAAHIHNAEFTGLNVTKFGWVLSTEPTNATLIDPGGDTTVIAQISGYAKCLAYPATVPGQSVTKTIRLAVTEATSRVGFLADIDLDFTDTNFSDGRPATAIPDIGTKVGFTTLLDFLEELAGTYIDVRVGVVGGRLALQVYEKDTMGAVSGQTLDGTNLEQLEADSEILGFTKAWVRWDGGWTYLDRGGDGDETAIEIGAPVAIEEVQRMASAALGELSSPRTEITATYRPGTAQTLPQMGDTVIAPTGTERVVGKTVTENAQTNEPPEISLTLRDVLKSMEARQAAELRKL